MEGKPKKKTANQTYQQEMSWLIIYSGMLIHSPLLWLLHECP